MAFTRFQGTTVSDEPPNNPARRSRKCSLVRTITPTPGAVTWTGQTLGLKVRIGVVAGNVTWAGATDIFLFDSGANLGGPVIYALASDTSAYANGMDRTSEAKVLETVGAAGSRDTFGEGKAVDTT